jgi:acyl-CoA hydrolase
MNEKKAVRSSQVVMTQLVLPSHTNSLDTVFGGTVMSWIDICAAIAAQRHSNCDVVTASIDQLSFVAPIKSGWVVNLKSSVNFTSNTSMEVGVRVDAENPKTGELFHTASAYLTFVAIGQDGKPTRIPSLIVDSDIEKRRFSAGENRRKRRLEARS